VLKHQQQQPEETVYDLFFQLMRRFFFSSGVEARTLLLFSIDMYFFSPRASENNAAENFTLWLRQQLSSSLGLHHCKLSIVDTIYL